MELLSPAGNREALVAAVSCGADAVYLGYTAFGARSYAGNFDAEQLKEAIEYAHERGKKIFVTVNTLVKQCETDDLCDVLELLCNCGADAAIVQDLGAARLARARFPELTLHASTQMTVNNAQGAKLLGDLGFTRVVPARECSLEELRNMADTGVEIEAFAHGALCVAVSGQCLFSSMIGGRSGNRGRCAQPCRLPYKLDDGTSGYLLSTRDLMLIDKIPQMRDAGVYSFKLEGRMKRPEYVGVITRAYREAIDAAQAHVTYHPGEKTIRDLKQVFNRGGFTEGYVMHSSNAALMSWERPNHWGIRVGRIMSSRGQLARVCLEEKLNDGDGLQVRGREEIDFTYSGKDTARGEEATVRIASGKYQPGDPVYRLTDAVQMAEIREIMAKEQSSIPLDAALTAVPGELPSLALSDRDGHTILVSGDQIVQNAQQRALDHDGAWKQLSKMGGTPYVLASLKLHSEGAFMTAGMLNSLRRDALDAMRRERIRIVRRNAESNVSAVQMPEQQKLLIAQSECLEDMLDLLACGADVFAWEPQVYTPQAITAQLEKNPGVQPVLVLPAVMSSEELADIHALVCRPADRFSGVMANNIGQFGLKWPVPVYGGQGLNVMNGECAAFYTGLGAKRLTASCELSLKELRELIACGGNYEIEVYGRTQLMLLSHCPRRTKAGDQRQDAACNACVSNGGCPQVYTDRKGYRFPARRIKMVHGCVVRLYNSMPTDMVRSAKKLYDTGICLRVSFTDEPIERQKEIVSSYRSIIDCGMAAHDMTEAATSGHLSRGVE
ncbi:MAG: U32 family peptidase [Clostridia bacterium]|nr:U32 family peptidase [Clostridia bacterium]